MKTIAQLMILLYIYLERKQSIFYKFFKYFILTCLPYVFCNVVHARLNTLNKRNSRRLKGDV